MEQFRKWLPHPALPALAPRARLEVEQLEQRDVPSASPFVDLAGNRFDFIVNEDHQLLERFPSGLQVKLADNVQMVHAFRDPAGALGLDLVFTNNLYFQLSGGTFKFINVNVLAASTTFAANGLPVMDIVFTNHDAFQFSIFGAQFISHNIQFLSNYRDLLGFVGLDIVTTDNDAFEFDSLGGRRLGGDIRAVERFNDTVTLTGQTFFRQSILDFVNEDHELFQFDSTGLRKLGNDIDP
jgi:hypothetical protein